jgi:LysM repeat protein
MNKSFVYLLFGIVVIFSLTYRISAKAQDSRAYDLIAMVNQLRAEQGLPALQINSLLMSAAQSQTDWRVSSGNYITHSGEGGTTPSDRAVAAGYGGGAKIIASENIAYTSGFNPQKVVYDLWSDDVHYRTMTNPQYVDIGAGVSDGGGFVHYTILVGVIAGQARATSTPSTSSSVPQKPTSGTIISTNTNLVVKATPASDGSITHVVQAGQAPYTIAVVYGITTDELFKLNNLDSNSLIYPGQKLIIQAAYTPTPALDTETPRPPTETVSITLPPREVTQTPTQQPPTPTETPLPAAKANAVRWRRMIGAVLIFVSTVGSLILLLSGFRKKE